MTKQVYEWCAYIGEPSSLRGHRQQGMRRQSLPTPSALARALAGGMAMLPYDFRMNPK